MSGSPRKGLRVSDRTVSFTFDGRRYEGQEGDTVASALLASRVRMLARSSKYHRPRGLLSAGPEEPSALLTCGAPPYNVPNLPATGLELHEGMQVFSQNRWPSLRHDLGALLGLGGSVFSAGFYYKTFMWPGWRSYEGVIRRLAGMGNAPEASDLGPPRVEHVDCDVLVAGAGPAGIAAALSAARAGARTVVCEREPAIGGELEFEDATIDGKPATDWIAAARQEMTTRGVRLLTETSVVGEAGRLITAHREPGGLAADATAYRIRVSSLVMATGATEQPIVFIDNDRPGVMLLGAAEKYLARYGVSAGETAVLFGNHNRLYPAARRLRDAGVRIAAIVDSRTRIDTPDRALLTDEGVVCLSGHAVVAALGRGAVSGARVAPVGRPDDSRDFDCDTVLVSGGWRPHAHAVEPDSGFRSAAGAAAATYEIGNVIASGHSAGREAAGASPHANANRDFGEVSGDPGPELETFWRSPAPPAAEKRQFVDLQNDVTVADLRQAVDHGFDDIEHAKRFTALAVGTEQGETSGLAGAAILAELAGRDETPPRPSRRRPPYRPATLSTLAGRRRGMSLTSGRHTRLHAWHLRNGAVLEDAGGWQRPRYYRANGNDPASAAGAEAATVRGSGGIVDASTLGKIEIAGPGAGAFLDHLYLTRASTIEVGRSRYMMLLREDGMVLDDGIVLRLAEDRFLATISSGHAGLVVSHFEFYRDRSVAFRGVAIAVMTDVWSVIATSGPNSREMLGSILGSDWPDRLRGLSHMGFIDGQWRDRALRVLRAGFSGELAFELHCRERIVEPLWQALVDAGMTPYGLEALDVLRVEKGYLTSAEINGQTTPQDLGFDFMVAPGNPCVGRDLLDRPGLHAPRRERLVGLQASDEGQAFFPGAQVTTLSIRGQSCGHVTSAVHSPALGRWVGLALVAREQSALGTELLARDPLHSRETRVRVAPTAHFDPDGARMKS